jgi:RNA ligase (TIGR02306 family)
LEGLDVTNVLNVKKHEEVIPKEMSGKSKCFHPTIVPKPSEVRIQSFPGLINEFTGKYVAITTKVDGLASSYINDNGEIYICSHTHSLLEDENNIYWQMAYKYKLVDILKEIGNYSIQGEIAGVGIRGNKMDLEDIELFVFKVFNNDKQEYLTPKELISFCNKYNLKHVPMELDVLFNFTIEDLLELAKGKYETSGKKREGIVIVQMENYYSEILCGRLSMKVINNDYLL